MRHAIAVIAVAACVVGLVQTSSHGAAARIPHTVIVIDGHQPQSAPVVRSRLCGASPDCANGKDRIDVVELLSGRVPPAPVTATVLTDESCLPDRYGISHCLNKLRLEDGSEILVRHSHNMTLYACLSPGETVRVTTVR